MGVNYSHEFWTESEKYHELAKTFEQNIEVTYPDRVTSRSMCKCLEFCNWCGHPMHGKAEYYEYRGPNVAKV